MSTSVIPDLIDAVIAAAETALPDVKVYDGYPNTNAPIVGLVIGVEDPSDLDAATSAESTQQWAHAHRAARNEEGDLTCAAIAWDGGSVQKVARDAAYSMTDAVETLLRSNPTLGLPTLIDAEYGSNTTLTQNQDENGAMALVMFRIHFRARI